MKYTTYGENIFIIQVFTYAAPTNAYQSRLKSVGKVSYFYAFYNGGIGELRYRAGSTPNILALSNNGTIAVFMKIATKFVIMVLDNY